VQDEEREGEAKPEAAVLNCLVYAYERRRRKGVCRDASGGVAVERDID
jgi:hypothetical protein